MAFWSTWFQFTDKLVSVTDQHINTFTGQKMKMNSIFSLYSIPFQSRMFADVNTLLLHRAERVYPLPIIYTCLSRKGQFTLFLCVFFRLCILNKDFYLHIRDFIFSNPIATSTEKSLFQSPSLSQLSEDMMSEHIHICRVLLKCIQVSRHFFWLYL